MPGFTGLARDYAAHINAGVRQVRFNLELAFNLFIFYPDFPLAPQFIRVRVRRTQVALVPDIRVQLFQEPVKVRHADRFAGKLPDSFLDACLLRVAVRHGQITFPILDPGSRAEVSEYRSQQVHPAYIFQGRYTVDRQEFFQLLRFAPSELPPDFLIQFDCLVHPLALFDAEEPKAIQRQGESPVHFCQPYQLFF